MARLGLFSWIFLIGFTAWADCNSLPIEKLNAALAMPTQDFFQRADQDLAVMAAKKQIARQIFANFLTGGTNLESQVLCLPEKKDQNAIRQLLHQEALTYSLETLKSSGSERLRALATQNRIDDSETAQAFFLKGHEFGVAPAPFRGGISFSTGMIYLDLSQIPKADWFIIVIHELSHKSDARLWEAIDRVTNLELKKKVAAIASHAGSAPGPQDQLVIDSWIWDGLNVGLLAELRAWVQTVELYRIGVSENLWETSPWLEGVLKTKKQGETLAGFLLRILLERKRDPDFSKELWVWPTIREAYSRALEKIRSTPAEEFIPRRLK